jgi:hypothetical protein
VPGILEVLVGSWREEWRKCIVVGAFTDNIRLKRKESRQRQSTSQVRQEQVNSPVISAASPFPELTAIPVPHSELGEVGRRILAGTVLGVHAMVELGVYVRVGKLEGWRAS